jgi:hypothetical protein
LKTIANLMDGIVRGYPYSFRVKLTPAVSYTSCTINIRKPINDNIVTVTATSIADGYANFTLSGVNTALLVETEPYFTYFVLATRTDTSLEPIISNGILFALNPA